MKTKWSEKTFEEKKQLVDEAFKEIRQGYDDPNSYESATGANCDFLEKAFVRDEDFCFHYFSECGQELITYSLRAEEFKYPCSFSDIVAKTKSKRLQELFLSICDRYENAENQKEIANLKEELKREKCR